MKNKQPHTIPALLFTALALSTLHAQLSPGPYEFLPFNDGFIVEAFKDLNMSRGAIADWSGWASSAWTSPNAYDNHEGTDIALQTGTPLYAFAAGTVIEVERRFAAGDHSRGGHGNYVKIAADHPAPSGDSLEYIYAHMLSVSVEIGDRVNVGDQVGLSDNTGNSTSEHIHIQSEIGGNQSRCPLYWGHYKYPIVFNPTGTSQIGHIVRVTTETTPIRPTNLDHAAPISTAHRGQLYFSSFAKRGYYQIFVPDQDRHRSAWIRATDVQEIYTGTVIQTLPDTIDYAHIGKLVSTYPIRKNPDDSSESLATIFFGGGRFVADKIENGYYRIPVPGTEASWGWVKADNKMIVYPEAHHPDIDPAKIPFREFPIIESFSETGKSFFGRAKFTRAVVRNFSPPSPGGDGKALFITDANNTGDGLTESVLVGIQGHENYYVECDVYLNFHPSYVNPALNRWERYGIFLRDDGFAGMNHGFEGAGNGYALLYDSDDGQIRPGKLQNGSITSFLRPQELFITESGWHTFRIEARGDQIRYLIDGELLLEVTDKTFPAGQAGIGYYWNPNGSYPSQRGAYFDNFVADTLEPVKLGLSDLKMTPAGTIKFRIHNNPGSTTRIEQTDNLGDAGAWQLLSDVENRYSIMPFEDSSASDADIRFYRATNK